MPPADEVPDDEVPDDAPPRAVSVVVPLHGAVPHIEAALAPLITQLEPDDELVVVDNGVTPQARATLDAHPGLVVVPAHDVRGAGAARNAGARWTTRARVVFCDGDDVPGEHFLDAMRRALDDNPLVGSHEHNRLLNPGRPDLPESEGEVWSWKGSPDWPFVGTCGMGIHRALLDRLGGFDTRIPSLEDVELCFRAARLGIRPVVAADAIMHIRARPTALLEARRLYHQGRASVWLERWYAADGIPRDGRVRGLLGWVRHLLGAARRDPVRRRESISRLGWKAGRARAALDRDVGQRMRGA